MDEFLLKIKRLNWVLAESTTGNLSYEDLSKILSELTEANFYILDNKGKVLGVSYDRATDTSTISGESGEETVPFANVTFLDADKNFELNSLNNIGDLKTELNKKIKESGDNRFYVVRIDGTFDKIGYRSEYAQKKPYKPLAKVMETDQTFFENKNVKGTVVGLYCPEYMGDLNAVGWHFHFITADKKAGGHVFEVNAKNLTVTMDRTDNFFMILPDNEMFNSFDLTIDQSEDIKKVETGEK